MTGLTRASQPEMNVNRVSANRREAPESNPGFLDRRDYFVSQGGGYRASDVVRGVDPEAYNRVANTAQEAKADARGGVAGSSTGKRNDTRSALGAGR